MQRLVEQPVDEGDVIEGATHLGRVHYHLSVYQHFSEHSISRWPTKLVPSGPRDGDCIVG